MKVQRRGMWMNFSECVLSMRISVSTWMLTKGVSHWLDVTYSFDVRQSFLEPPHSMLSEFMNTVTMGLRVAVRHVLNKVKSPSLRLTYTITAGSIWLASGADHPETTGHQHFRGSNLPAGGRSLTLGPNGAVICSPPAARSEFILDMSALPALLLSAMPYVNLLSSFTIMISHIILLLTKEVILQLKK